MPVNDEALLFVWEWIEKAENDLKNAAHTLKLTRECPTDTVCFHAQQCAEKYLKAYLTGVGVDFPKTHDIERLVKMIPRDGRPDLTSEEQHLLTDYATGGPVSGMETD